MSKSTQMTLVLRKSCHQPARYATISAGIIENTLHILFGNMRRCKRMVHRLQRTAPGYEVIVRISLRHVISVKEIGAYFQIVNIQAGALHKVMGSACFGLTSFEPLPGHRPAAQDKPAGIVFPEHLQSIDYALLWYRPLGRSCADLWFIARASWLVSFNARYGEGGYGR